MSQPKRTVSSKRTAISALFLLALLIALLSWRYVEKQIYPRHYTDYVTRYAEAYDVPENLIYAVIRTESDFDRDAVSSVGAVGLMQLMPETFEWLRDYQLRETLELGMRADPETNVRYGVYYLRFLYDRYGTWLEACAAYNAGPGRVDAWLDDASLVDVFGHLEARSIPFDETRAYVMAIERSYAAYDRLYPVDSPTPFR